MKAPLVIAQIVNYNGLTLTDAMIECLRAISMQTYNNTIIHVIDNSSSDGSVQWIRDNFPDIQITVTANKGYVSNNLGIKYFREMGGDYLLILNNDMVLEQKFIEKMVIYNENRQNTGISSGIIHFRGKSDYINSTGIMLNRAGFSANRDYGKPEHNTLSEENIAGISGGCMFVSAKAVNATGLFDEIYGSYFEDTDLCIRLLMETDMKIAINTDAHAYHDPSSSWSKYRGKKDFLILRNQYMLIVKLFPMNLLGPAKIYLIRTRLFKRNLLHIKVFANLLFLLPVILIKRMMHSIKKKHKLDTILVKSFKPFPIENPIFEYAHIEKTCNQEKELSNRIIFGINDNMIGPGLSPLSDDYPKGRYVNGKCVLYLKNPGTNLLIHGYGNGKITVNEEQHFSVKGFFDIYTQPLMGNSITIETSDRIKLIEAGYIDEKA